jgi:hypothetical protein
MVLQTWDQLLNAHFHVHCLVPGGALADDGTRWGPTHPAFLFPVKALGAVFRAQFLEALRPAHTTAALTFSDATAALATPQGFTRLLDHLYATAWACMPKPPLRALPKSSTISAATRIASPSRMPALSTSTMARSASPLATVGPGIGWSR